MIYKTACYKNGIQAVGLPTPISGIDWSVHRSWRSTVKRNNWLLILFGEGFVLSFRECLGRSFGCGSHVWQWEPILPSCKLYSLCLLTQFILLVTCFVLSVKQIFLQKIGSCPTSTLATHIPNVNFCLMLSKLATKFIHHDECHALSRKIWPWYSWWWCGLSDLIKTTSRCWKRSVAPARARSRQMFLYLNSDTLDAISCNENWPPISTLVTSSP